MGKNKIISENKMNIDVNSKMKRKLKNAKNKIKINKKNVFSVFNYFKKNYKLNNIFKQNSNEYINTLSIECGMQSSNSFNNI